MTTLATHTAESHRPARRPALTFPPRLEVVIPVHNEERSLPDSVIRLRDRLALEFDFPFRVTIADNASSDGTAELARSLARDLTSVHYLRIEQKGRGRALRAAWSASDAEVVAYMDVDLSTDLAHLPALLEALLAGRGDIVVGSRLARGAQVTRGIKRELLSRSYNALLRMALGAGFSDAQCGFKAARSEVVRALLPLIEDDSWFFDTELLYLAQRNAFSIREIPVRWVDDPDSRVDIVRTAIDDLKGIARLQRRTRDGRDRISSFADTVRPQDPTRAPGASVRPADYRRRRAAHPTRSDGRAARRVGAQPTGQGLP